MSKVCKSNMSPEKGGGGKAVRRRRKQVKFAVQDAQNGVSQGGAGNMFVFLALLILYNKQSTYGAGAVPRADARTECDSRADNE